MLVSEYVENLKILKIKGTPMKCYTLLKNSRYKDYDAIQSSRCHEYSLNTNMGAFFLKTDGLFVFFINIKSGCQFHLYKNMKIKSKVPFRAEFIVNDQTIEYLEELDIWPMYATPYCDIKIRIEFLKEIGDFEFCFDGIVVREKEKKLGLQDPFGEFLEGGYSIFVDQR